jgi:hypothetical protein
LTILSSGRFEIRVAQTRCLFYELRLYEATQ